MGRVVIGTDPHKRSATIEVREEREVLLATGRFGMDKGGHRQLLGYVRQWPGAGVGGGRRERRGPAVGGAAVGRWGDGVGCAGEAGRSGAGVRQWTRS